MAQLLALLLLQAAGTLGMMEERSYEHFVLLNELRAAGYTCPNGRSYEPNDVPLKFDCRLWKASQLHSQDMADNGYFSHTSQDGRSPWDRAEAQGIRANGENIAAGRSGASAVLDQWKNSDGHCKNMMNPSFRVFAVGYAYNPTSQYRHYWTQMFKSSDVSDLDTSCYRTESTTTPTTSTLTTTTTTTTSTTTTTTTSTTMPTTTAATTATTIAETTATSTVENSTQDTEATPNPTTTGSANSSASLAIESTDSTSTSMSSSGQTTSPAGPARDSISTTASVAPSTTIEVETSAPQFDEASPTVTSSPGPATTSHGIVRGQIVVWSSGSSDFVISPQLQDLLKAFLRHLGGGLLQAITFSARRLRRLQGSNITVTFTAEVPAGRADEAAARLQEPEAAAEALTAALAEVEAPEGVEVLSVDVTDIQEAQPAEAADWGWLVAVLAGLAVIIGVTLGAWCWCKHQHTRKDASSQGAATNAAAEVPTASLPVCLGGKDVTKSKSSNVVVTSL